ncbi:Uncharacterized protein DBV15_12702 [Temnothorax longispinosus]|uniref:Transposable element P transposase-like C-terminal domain-containing protein n=1 Tax=Temnothorax longispinosus TaxID=300112 RepID=A0A4S2KYV3_9HYME|nr:Uncharacterized protein DBV15_12702 [Temnothorax longispinosus]
MLAPYTNENETTDLHIKEEFLTKNEINNNKENRVPCFNSATYIPTLEEEQILKSLDEIEIVDNIEDQGLLYITGYVAYRFKSKHDTLGKFSTTIFCKNTNVTESEQNVSCLISPLNDDNCEEYILSNMLAPYTNENETTDLYIEEEFLTENEINNNKENRVPCFNSATYIPTLEEEQILKSLDEMEIVDNIEDQGLLYIAGYVAYRFKSKHDTLGIKTCELPIVNDLDWLQFISRGKCMYPSSDLLKAAHIMNTEFSKYHGSKLSKDKFIFKKLTDKIEIALKPIELPGEVLLCLVRTRTYIRVSSLDNYASLPAAPGLSDPISSSSRCAASPWAASPTASSAGSAASSAPAAP